MSRKARGPSLISDAKTAPAPLEESWRALFGTQPPHAASWIDQAIAWQQQALVHGDVTPAIRGDLRLAAERPRGSDAIASVVLAGPRGDEGVPNRNGAVLVDDGENVSSRTLPARSGGKKRGSSGANIPSALAALPPASSQLLPGTKLVKVHAGVTHVVEVTADAMVYKGERYASLSAIAKVITGTHWNGLLFFGLRVRKTYPAKASARA